MVRLFNIPPQSSLEHVSGNGLILDSFLKAAMSINSKEVYWPCIITLCLYAQFLLDSTSGDCDFKIIHILDQVKSGLNPMLVILAKTLIGLDNLPEIYWEESHVFGGKIFF